MFGLLSACVLPTNHGTNFDAEPVGARKPPRVYGSPCNCSHMFPRMAVALLIFLLPRWRFGLQLLRVSWCHAMPPGAMVLWGMCRGQVSWGAKPFRDIIFMAPVAFQWCLCVFGLESLESGVLKVGLSWGLKTCCGACGLTFSKVLPAAM